MDKYCSICGSDKNLIYHHLSYEPEIVVIVCRKCHQAMHRLAEIDKKHQIVIVDWVKQYGDLWKNGRGYYKSGSYYSGLKIEQVRENNFKKLPPEKMLKRLEKMQREVKIINKEK